MNISILGSTGSIGTQTLDIVRSNPQFRVCAMSANSNVDLLSKQIEEFKPELVCVCDNNAYQKIKNYTFSYKPRIISGNDGLNQIATYPKSDIVVTAVVGISGLIPTIEAIKAGKNIALANKETLVTGGHIVMPLAKEMGVSILPVDSEHSAIFQSLQGCRNKSEIKRILLTASGGPFFGKTYEELKNITPAQALKHPNWNMGAKVTIDSSTLVNKGLEVIEAKWLFDVDIDDILVLIHRQSIVHSMVEFCDNGVIAQLGAPDMRLPIQYALTYPNRLPMKNNEMDLFKIASLTFNEPDTNTFHALEVAKEAGRKGGLYTTAFNSSDEAAVAKFLAGEIGYLDIAKFIEKAVSDCPNVSNPSPEQIFECDKWARSIVQ